MVFLHVFRDSERNAEEWVGQKWQFRCDVIIEKPLIGCITCFIRAVLFRLLRWRT